MKKLNLKKLFLIAAIVSVAVSAVIGIGVILFGDFGDFETKVLLTTVTVSVISILGLACGAFLETGHFRWLPISGIVFAIISGVMWIVLIWIERYQTPYFTEALMSATLLAAACAHVSLVSLARLDARFLWSRWLLYGGVAALSCILLWLTWTHFDPTDTWLARVMGALSIVIAALTVVTPVLHKLSSDRNDIASIDSEIARLRSRIKELELMRTKH